MNKYATEEWVTAQIKRGVAPLSEVTVYEKPTTIPVENGSQIVFMQVVEEI